MRWLWLAGICITACTACGGDVTLQVNRPDLERGMDGVLELVNGSSSSVLFSLCSPTVEHQDGSEWIPLAWREGACPGSFDVLEAGESVTSAFTVPSDAELGVYRMSTEIEVKGETETLSTDLFRVVADGLSAD